MLQPFWGPHGWFAGWRSSWQPVLLPASLFITGRVSEEECEERDEMTVLTRNGSCCGDLLVPELSGGEAGAPGRNLHSRQISLGPPPTLRTGILVRTQCSQTELLPASLFLVPDC